MLPRRSLTQSATKKGTLMVISNPKSIDRIQKNIPRKYQSVPDAPASHIAAETNTLRQMKEAFISTASHELRTPLTSIVGFSEFLLNQTTEGGLDVETQKRILGIILENATKLESIIDALLDVKRFQSRQNLNLHRSLCCVEDFVVDALFSLQEKNPDSRITVKFSNGRASVWVDLERIQQVLIELVTNSIKFSSGKLITVSGHITGNSYCLSVQDNGPGIASEQIGEIFRPLYRIDSSSTAPGGLGLGLSWAKGVVEAHGGHLLVKSEVGQGTKVSMILPLWNECADMANMDMRS